MKYVSQELPQRVSMLNSKIISKSQIGQKASV